MLDKKSDQHNQKFYAIGLMSGTSADGVDVALIETDGRGFVKYIAGDGVNYPPELRARILAAFGHKAPANAPEFQGLTSDITMAHCDAVNKLIDKTGITPDIIGFHGQTIWHEPPFIDAQGVKINGQTCQIGDGQLLADQCGVMVVDDFRSADMRAGGQGAPLLPLYHRVLLRQNAQQFEQSGQSGKSVDVILNLGGVANITAVFDQKDVEQKGDAGIHAFDVGPANALMDDLLRQKTGQPYDANGAMAAQGVADMARVNQWLTDPFFDQLPPKSLDRDYWRNLAVVDDLPLQDGLASLAMFTVLSVKRGLDLLRDQYGLPQDMHLYVAGGGRHNQFLMRQLAQNLAPSQIEQVDVLGWDGDSLEAQGFAYLAVRSYLGLALSLPGTTGCDAPVTGGVLHHPPRQATSMMAASPKAIAKAVSVLRQGDLVAIPTETVYGLAGRADDHDAIAKIYQAKGRPSINPLIIHVDTIDMAQIYAQFDARARAVAAAFWPGPLTIVLPLSPHGRSAIAANVTAGLDTIAVRCPAHPVMRDVIRGLNIPLAAPSANKSGFLSATRAIDVAQDFADSDQPAMIIAAKGVDVGLESTILDLSVDVPEILREGAINADQIAQVLDMDVVVVVSKAPDLGNEGDELKSHIKSPGQLLAHYAPRLPMRLRAVDVRPDEALLAFGSIAFMGIVGGGRASDLPVDAIRNLSETGDLQEAAANLYAMLHDLDKSGKVGIAVMDIPRIGVGLAINERLQRGAQNAGKNRKT